MRLGRTIYQYFVYYLSFVFFGIGGGVLNLFSLVCCWLPATPRRQRFFQRLIHRHFAAWLWWMRWSGQVVVTHDGFERLPRGSGLLVVANHPGLMDITYLLARIPEAVCVFKPGIRRNPVLGASARLAGYLASDAGLDLLRAASARAAAGHTLVLFPEGTRTRGGLLNPFKGGFAVIAQRASVPTQTVLITCDSKLLVKGRPWWKLPRLPAHVTLSLGPLFPPPPPNQTAAYLAEVEDWFRGALAGRPQAVTGEPIPAAA